MQLNYYRRGHGEPLVLIHGIGSRWQMWEPVIDGLVEHRDVIAIDLPGFGASPMPPAGTPAGVDSLTTLVAEFLNELGVERPHCAGNSLGGLIVLELSKRGVVRSANGVSPAGFANRPESLLAEVELRLAVSSARRLVDHVKPLAARPRGRKLLLGTFVAHPERVTPHDALESARALAHAPWFDDTLGAIDPAGFTGGEQIATPVTITWGDKDRVLLPHQQRRAGESIPGARLVTLTGCGHVPTYDDPEQVTRALLEGSAGG